MIKESCLFDGGDIAKADTDAAGKKGESIIINRNCS